MFNGHSLLSDTVILMRAHVGTQAPIYVSCLHILNTLLTDPVLREGTLRAIPADLPENGTSPFPSHPPTLTPALPTHLPCLPAVCSPSLFEPPAAREPGWGRVCHVPALRTPPRLTAFSRPFSASGFRPSASGLRAASLSLSLDTDVPPSYHAQTVKWRHGHLHTFSSQAHHACRSFMASLCEHKHRTHHQRLSTLHLYTN